MLQGMQSRGCVPRADAMNGAVGHGPAAQPAMLDSSCSCPSAHVVPFCPCSPARFSLTFATIFPLSTQVTAYYAPQFAELRRRCVAGGEAAFLASLSRCRKWASRGGKSAAYFARSCDKRWVWRARHRHARACSDRRLALQGRGTSLLLLARSRKWLHLLGAWVVVHRQQCSMHT